MDDHALIGPIEPRLGRWMLDRLVATAVRYGHPFAIVFARTPVPDATAERFASVLRGRRRDRALVGRRAAAAARPTRPRPARRAR